MCFMYPIQCVKAENKWLFNDCMGHPIISICLILYGFNRIVMDLYINKKVFIFNTRKINGNYSMI